MYTESTPEPAPVDLTLVYPRTYQEWVASTLNYRVGHWAFPPPRPLDEELVPLNKTSGYRNSTVDPHKPITSTAHDEILLIYPFTGIGSVTVALSDLQRLEPGEYLNDTLIELGLKLWLDGLRKERAELAAQVHIFNSFFFTRLNQESGYRGVQKWTSKFDFFDKKYIIIPINQQVHWYLAIICHPGLVLTPNPTHKAKIFIFDSLGLQHPDTFNTLATYLRLEAQNKKGTSQIAPVLFQQAIVPIQPNYHDCGIYLLHTVSRFMSKPDHFSCWVNSSHSCKTSHIWKDEPGAGRRIAFKMEIMELSALWKGRLREKRGGKGSVDGTNSTLAIASRI